MLSSAGDREAAYELEAKGQEHIQLAQQARRRTNQAAFIGSNLTNLCRMTVCTRNDRLSPSRPSCPSGYLCYITSGAVPMFDVFVRSHFRSQTSPLAVR